MQLRPAAEGSGIRFIRTDVETFDPIIRAKYNHVTSTNLGTTLSNDEGTMVSTVEHLMAALWGCGIDNVDVLLDGPEVPIMDGSAEPFVFLVECAGRVQQKQPRAVIEVLKPVRVEQGDKFLEIVPAEGFSIDLEIDFAANAIARQRAHFDPETVSFRSDLCRARTFGFENEVKQLRQMGLARGGSMENAIVVSGDKVLNKEGLRYQDEFVRHKILDCVGDFYLSGAPIQGAFHGYRTGHELNNKLLHALFEDSSAWRQHS